MTIMPSKTKLEAIRKSMEKALEAVAKEYGIDSFKMGAMTYDDSGFRTKIEALFEGGETPEMKFLKSMAGYIGFKPEIVNAKIEYSKKEFTVVGLSRTKLHLKDTTGKTWKASSEDVLRVLTAQKSPFVKDVINNLQFVPVKKANSI